jgi:uncharacterized protein (DUF58 family)
MPFAVLGALVPAASMLSAGIWLMLATIALFDAVSARLAARRIVLQLPEVTRLSQNRDGNITVTINMNSESSTARNIRIGLPLPEEIESEQDILEAALPAGHTSFTIAWPCKASARGLYRLTRAHFDVPSPLGLWNAKGASDVSMELRVYPDMITQRNAVASLFLNRGNFGMHVHRMIGKGREFEKLREYVRGDSFEDIHWKATAKRGKPITKVFQIERTQEVYVLVDTSRLITKQAEGESILDMFLASSLVVGMAAERNGDLFGMMTFSDKVDQFIRAGSGTAHYNACRDAIYSLKARLVTPDFEAVSSFIHANLRRRALLIILTDLSDPAIADSFVKSIDPAARKHVIMVNMMRRPGTDPLFSTGDLKSDDELYDRLAGHMTWHSLNELEKTLKLRGIGLAQVEKAGMTVDIVSQYMNIKSRQIL